MKLLLVELGSCGANYNTDYIIEQLGQNFKFTEKFEDADNIVMLGGCCCTEVHLYNTIEYINYILELKKDSAKTYLTGCITRGFNDIYELNKLEDYLHRKIDYVVDHYNPNELLRLIYNNSINTLMDNNYGGCVIDENSARIYIQNGCTHKCTFCKTNYLNCNTVDAPIEKVREAIDFLDNKKIKNIELRGLNLSQYGLSLYNGYKLMDICEYIETKKNIEGVMLSSFSFSDAIKNNFSSRLKYLQKTNHINGSLESGSNRILELMNKGFTKEEFLQFCDECREIYQKQFTLSIISGFPTETNNDCCDTIRALKRINPCLVNINTYLDSKFVPSHSMEQLTEKQINEHTRMYTKMLKASSIKYKINGAN